MVKRWRSHKQWITNVHWQRGGIPRELVSGSRNGEVMVWDIRLQSPVEEFSAGIGNVMRTFNVHEHAPVFACGGDQGVSVYSFDGQRLNTIKPYSPPFPIRGGGPAVATAFHPHAMELAVATLGNSHVDIKSCLPQGFHLPKHVQEHGSPQEFLEEAIRRK